MTELVTDYYKTLPHDFGIKKPDIFFNLLRVKEETKKLEAINDIQIAEQSLLHSIVSLVYVSINIYFQYELKNEETLETLYS